MYVLHSETEAGLLGEYIEITSSVQNHRGCMLSPQLSLNGMIRYVTNMKIIICH